MKIEKLTDNKIRIIVNLEELETKNINLDDFIMNNIESQKFFLEILNRAEKEIGFKTNNCKLLIETFSSTYEYVWIFLDFIEFANVRGPRRPIYIKTIKVILLPAESEVVMPVDKPTVANADIVSKAISIKSNELSLSNITTINIPITNTPSAKDIINIAVLANPLLIVLLNAYGFLSVINPLK